MKQIFVVAVMALVGLMATGAWAMEQGEGGENARKGRGMRKGMREGERKSASQVPGMEEEKTRHREAMKAIMEEMMAEGREARASYKGAEGEEAKAAVKADAEARMRTYAEKMVDERLSHAQKAVDLLKANRDAAVEATVKRMQNRAKERMQGGREGMKGKREGMKGGENGSRRMHRKRGTQEGVEGGTEGGDAMNYEDLTDDEIARAIDEALAE